jgi:hypothetical protein
MGGRDSSAVGPGAASGEVSHAETRRALGGPDNSLSHAAQPWEGVFLGQALARGRTLLLLRNTDNELSVPPAVFARHCLPRNKKTAPPRG